jgi:MFS superfamily sulfate permease-like transporter
MESQPGKVKIKKGLKALQFYWKKDLKAGFLVFLIALPLSLGIAEASGFPPAMGVITAIVGGLFSSFLKVSELSIKGPAAGLITITAAAVFEFEAMGVNGWNAVAAVVVVMALVQIVLGGLKLGDLSAFFPYAAVHGMLAAIGIIIVAKETPVLLGVAPSLYEGLNPLELIASIPRFIKNSTWVIALVGAVSIVIMFLLPVLKGKKIKQFPAPLLVLLISVPMALYYDFSSHQPDFALVHIGDFWGTVNINADFSYIGTFVFWKYVIMFTFVSSLESLLTVKAIDNLDPNHRISNYNGDLIGQGVGNVFAGLFGGLPMISEVVRSSANIRFGAYSKWSNFFHGVFLLSAMLFIIPFVELIPNSALAAILIYAGYKLASPQQFVQLFRLGIDQFIIFLVTIIVTIWEDLLLGIAAGIFIKFLFHLYNGPGFKSLLKANFEIVENGSKIQVLIKEAAVFTNLIPYKKRLDGLAKKGEMEITIDFTQAKFVDHSFISFIETWRKNNQTYGDERIKIIGLEKVVKNQ